MNFPRLSLAVIALFDISFPALPALAQQVFIRMQMQTEAGQLQDGVTAYKRGDFAQAFKVFQQLAVRGDAAAQHNLGILYYAGRGVPQNYAEAMKWLRLSADQNDAEAQDDIGIMYEKGEGVPQNYAEAMKWLRLSADQGNADAQDDTGFMYESGFGVPQDFKEAKKWYEMAASQGDAAAQHNLGVLYYVGRGVPQNYAEAMKWLRLSADQGIADAQTIIGTMYQNGEGVPRDFNEAMRWYQLAASHGSDVAENNIGVLYSVGRGVPQDYTEAEKWFRLALAANKNNATAQNNLTQTLQLEQAHALGTGPHSQSGKFVWLGYLECVPINSWGPFDGRETPYDTRYEWPPYNLAALSSPSSNQGATCYKQKDDLPYHVDNDFYISWFKAANAWSHRSTREEAQELQAAVAADIAWRKEQHVTDLRSGHAAPKNIEECMVAKGAPVPSTGPSGDDVLITPDKSFRVVRGPLLSFEGSEGLIGAPDDWKNPLLPPLLRMQSIPSSPTGATFEVDSNTYWPDKDRTVLKNDISVGGQYVSNDQAETALGEHVTIIHLRAVCVMPGE